MTLERAIEILDPEDNWSGGTPEDVEEVKEACRVACEVMSKNVAEKKKREERRFKYEKMRERNEAAMLEVFDLLASHEDEQ